MVPLPTLMAIGGAVDLDGPGELLSDFYQRAGGPRARIVILPTASTRADAGEEYCATFVRMGLEQPARILAIRQRMDAFKDTHLVILEEASGIFFCGGNQLRLSAILGGTPVEIGLHAAYRRGAVVAGTSAGAAALGTVMLAFGKNGPSPHQGMAQMVAGLGFTEQVIFDQHFRQRDRLGRLLYAVASNPRLIGVGVDENTAAILEGPLLRVMGKNAVTLVDGSDIRANTVAEIEGNGPVAVSSVLVHVLTRGFSYDLNQRCLVDIPARLGDST